MNFTFRGLSPTYLPTYLPTNDLPTYRPTYLATYLPTYLPTIDCHGKVNKTYTTSTYGKGLFCIHLYSFFSINNTSQLVQVIETRIDSNGPGGGQMGQRSQF